MAEVNGIEATRWSCDSCRESGTVKYGKGASVYDVLYVIELSHKMKGLDCALDLKKVHVEPAPPCDRHCWEQYKSHRDDAFTAAVLLVRTRGVDHDCDEKQCSALDQYNHNLQRRFLATIKERDARIAEQNTEAQRAIGYLLRATAMTEPPSTAPSALVAMAAIACEQAKAMHDGLHDAVNATAKATTRAEDAEARIAELETKLDEKTGREWADTHPSSGLR